MFDTPQAARIQAKDVGVGTLVWFMKTSVLNGWDCPAVICEVNERGDEFRVMSLMDMQERKQPYFVGRDPFCSSSQRNMRLASVAEVDAYLAEHKSERCAHQIIAEAQAAARMKAAA
jgi:hypothetical protein